jgi:hypothetical protein
LDLRDVALALVAAPAGAWWVAERANDARRDGSFHGVTHLRETGAAWSIVMLACAALHCGAVQEEVGPRVSAEVVGSASSELAAIRVPFVEVSWTRASSSLELTLFNHGPFAGCRLEAGAALMPERNRIELHFAPAEGTTCGPSQAGDSTVRLVMREPLTSFSERPLVAVSVSARTFDPNNLVIDALPVLIAADYVRRIARIPRSGTAGDEVRLEADPTELGTCASLTITTVQTASDANIGDSRLLLPFLEGTPGLATGAPCPPGAVRGPAFVTAPHRVSPVKPTFYLSRSDDDFKLRQLD